MKSLPASLLWTIGSVVAVTLPLALGGGAVRASDLHGVWLVQDRTANVRIAPCGDALCARVTTIFQPNDPATGAPWLDKNNPDPAKRHRPLLGLAIATGMRSTAPGKWIGRIYSIDYGRMYAGSITLLSPSQLKIEGCQLLICESEIWTRAE